MTPAHTLAMRQKLATSFDTIGSQVDELDQPEPESEPEP